MKSQSHLYPGFAHAGALFSVAAQRSLQGRLLAELAVQKLLVVGCGYGEEMDALLRWQPSPFRWSTVTAIDLADTSRQLQDQPRVSRLGRRFSFRQLDLLDADRVDGFGSFDAVQCGFVLHDVDWPQKESALRVLAHSVRSGGHVLISDVFVRSSGIAAEAAHVYDGFLREANAALRDRRIGKANFDALVGDGVTVGLRRSRQDAIRGNRDFFEVASDLVGRAGKVGLRLAHVARNPESEHLMVLLFVRG